MPYLPKCAHFVLKTEENKTAPAHICVGAVLKERKVAAELIVSGNQTRVRYFDCRNLASIVCCVCGTARSRSFGINLPVSLQTPYVPFLMRTMAASSC